MTKQYEVFSRDETNLPCCDRCGFEDEALETTEGMGTVELLGTSCAMERLCRYCYETELGNNTHISMAIRSSPDRVALSRGIVHAMNVLELTLRQEMQALVAGLARAIAEEAPSAHTQSGNITEQRVSGVKDRRNRAWLGRGNDAHRRINWPKDRRKQEQ